MNTMATSGFGNGALDSLAIATDHGRTRCVNAENPTGGKGHCSHRRQRARPVT